MIEFTGERVVPGAVNDDLWAEHVARYAFASRFARGGRVLDIGCGTGYGLAELARAHDAAVGIDVSAEAAAYARTNYSAANVRFVQASASALPFVSASFRLITAFEVIEHLEDWPRLVSEARRVLAPDGLFLVSTPNRLYYTESRGDEGSNPFHVHEFTFDEFRQALSSVFPQVVIFQQNRTESFAFSLTRPSISPLDARMDGSRGTPDHAHFFIALCGIDTIPEARTFIYLPRASNLLREREQHIQLLQRELQLTRAALDRVLNEHQELVRLHAEQKDQLEEHNRWALQLEKDWKASLARVAQLQDELKAEQDASRQVVASYASKVSELEQDSREKAQWALDTEARLSAELAAKCAELGEAVRLLDQAEATVTDRTAWAQTLQQKVERLETQLRMIRGSRWIKIGRMVGVGPRVQD